jgi:hypothetical protein
MTAQRKRRGRKPVTILRELATFARNLYCPYPGVHVSGRGRGGGCTRGRFEACVAELRTALKGAKKT